MTSLHPGLQGLDWNGQLKFGSNEFYGEAASDCVTDGSTQALYSALVAICDTQLVPVLEKSERAALHAAGMNYLQSVTPRLALGGEAFWLGQQRKSGTGFAGRFTGDAFVATAQVATTGLVSLTYVQRISEKVRFSPPGLQPRRMV